MAESIAFFGFDVNYLPRTLFSIDTVFGEAAHSSFESSMVIEAYMEQTDRFEGPGDLLSKFGVEIHDSARIWISMDRFAEEALNVGYANTEQMRSYFPREGDLVQFPFNGNIFQIMYVEHEKPFWPQGTRLCWELSLELFQYTGETFSTGDSNIDSVTTKYHVGSSNTDLQIPADNVQFEIDAAQICDFSEPNQFSVENPFGELF